MTTMTDLAIEAGELNSAEFKNADVISYDLSGVHITQMTLDDSAASYSGLTAGKYITCETKPFTDPLYEEADAISALSSELRKLIPQKGCVLTAGLGNPDATPDALGPSACEHILATRHIIESGLQITGIEHLRSVCVFRPGVLGQTGIEVQKLLKAVCKTADVCCLVAIDALAARSIKRLGCTIQISDTGLAPGSGIGNRRTALNAETIGIPVIAVGVPTMVNAAVLAHDLTGKEVYGTTDMIVTPKDIDTLVFRAGRLVGKAINAALQPSLSPEELEILKF